MEEFIAAINKHTDKFEFIISTPSTYLEDLKNEASQKDISFRVYNEDFFPLLMQYEEHYWSGYYTSRPNFKERIRDLTYMSQTS